MSDKVRRAAVKKQIIADMQAEGLTVVARYAKLIPNKTCRVFTDGNKIVVERHVPLAESQTMARDSGRQARASIMLGISMSVPNAYNLLTPEAQKQVDSELVGFDYSYTKVE